MKMLEETSDSRYRATSKCTDDPGGRCVGGVGEVGGGVVLLGEGTGAEERMGSGVLGPDENTAGEILGGF